MKGFLKVTKVSMCNPPMFHKTYPNRYNSNSLTSRSESLKSLRIEGIFVDTASLINVMDVDYAEMVVGAGFSWDLFGKPVKFFTPTQLVTVTSGILNFTSMDDNEWIKLETISTEVAKGHPMFDGGKTPNFAIAEVQEFKSKVKEGDIMEISCRPALRDNKDFTNVKLIQNLMLVP